MEATDLGTLPPCFTGDVSPLGWSKTSLGTSITDAGCAGSLLTVTGVVGAEGIFSFSSLGRRIWARTIGSLYAERENELMKLPLILDFKKNVDPNSVSTFKL